MKNLTKTEYFLELLEVGWDYAIDNVKIKYKYDNRVQMLCAIYNFAYFFMENDDVDGGLCYEIRSFIINKLKEYFENYA